MEKMRTRSFPSMTNYEIEQYLKRNDVIFIPVGNAEMHGALPVDVEYVQAEAFARLFAEQTDAIFFPNLVYFAAGGTCIGRGTVQMGMKEGYDYLYAIARSLLNQGFKRQVYIPSHRSSSLFAHPVLHQIFDDTKVSMLMLEPYHLFTVKGLMPKRPSDPKTPIRLNPITENGILGANTMALGAYKICGRLNDVPVGKEANISETICYDGWFMNQWYPDYDLFDECSTCHCPAPFYYKKWWDHGSAPLPETREKINIEADIGEKYLRKMVNGVDFNIYLNALSRLNEITQNEILPVYKDVLPRNKNC